VKYSQFTDDHDNHDDEITVAKETSTLLPTLSFTKKENKADHRVKQVDQQDKPVQQEKPVQPVKGVMTIKSYGQFLGARTSLGCC